MKPQELLIARFEGDDENDHRVAVFLQGGRFNGDRGAIVAPAPPMLYVTPCDCSIVDIDRCGSPTHWHDLDKLRELGDARRHGAYYVKVDQRPARSGMEVVLYWHAGHEQPADHEVARVQTEFRRKIAALTGADKGANTNGGT